MNAGQQMGWWARSAHRPGAAQIDVATKTTRREIATKSRPACPTARIVKGIPPFAESLDKLAKSADRAKPASFVCGNDQSAKRIVSELIELLAAKAVDTGLL